MYSRYEVVINWANDISVIERKRKIKTNKTWWKMCKINTQSHTHTILCIINANSRTHTLTLSIHYLLRAFCFILNCNAYMAIFNALRLSLSVTAVFIFFDYFPFHFCLCFKKKLLSVIDDHWSRDTHIQFDYHTVEFYTQPHKTLQQSNICMRMYFV